MYARTYSLKYTWSYLYIINDWKNVCFAELITKVWFTKAAGTARNYMLAFNILLNFFYSQNMHMLSLNMTWGFTLTVWGVSIIAPRFPFLYSRVAYKKCSLLFNGRHTDFPAFTQPWCICSGSTDKHSKMLFLLLCQQLEGHDSGSWFARQSRWNYFYVNAIQWVLVNGQHKSGTYLPCC